MEKLIGLRINIIPCKFNQEYNGETIKEYEFITKDSDGIILGHKYVIEEGMCGSGYCSASWIHEKTETLKEVGSLHYLPKIDMEFNDSTNHYNGNDLYIIYENDCNYYPSANIEIKFENWRWTERSKEKKPLYVFIGESGIGKSFIASNTNLKVFESDSNVNSIYGLNPNDYINYDIVVIGNKQLDIIKDLEYYLATVDLEIIQVSFNKL